MKSMIRHHKFHSFTAQYVMLFLLVATGFFAFNSLTGMPAKQFQVGMVTAAAYLFWGIFHHLSQEDLNWQVVVEYISIAIFGIAVLWMLLAYIY